MHVMNTFVAIRRTRFAMRQPTVNPSRQQCSVWQSLSVAAFSYPSLLFLELYRNTSRKRQHFKKHCESNGKKSVTLQVLCVTSLEETVQGCRGECVAVDVFSLPF